MNSGTIIGSVFGGTPEEIVPYLETVSLGQPPGISPTSTAWA